MRSTARLVAICLLLAACALQAVPDGVAGRPTAAPADRPTLHERHDLDGLRVQLGTGDFTEALILGQIAAQAWEAAGATVTLTEHLPGPSGARRALLAGDLDAAVDYTGAVWVTQMGNSAIRDPAEQYASVARVDRRRHGLVWSRPAPADAAYAIAVRRDVAVALGLRTLSDLAGFVARHPDRATLCVDPTFAARDDGLPALERVYGVTWPRAAVREMGPADVPAATARGERCAFGEVFATDGRVPALNLVTLDDPARAFVSYLPAVQVTADLVEEHPAVTRVIDEVFAPLDGPTVAALNAVVDLGAAYPADAAARYLVDQGFVR